MAHNDTRKFITQTRKNIRQVTSFWGRI